MLKITRIDGQDGARTFKLEGGLLAPWVSEVSNACTSGNGRSGQTSLDLSGLTFVDQAGARLLKGLIRRGIGISASTGFVAELLHLGEQEAEAQLVDRVRAGDEEASAALVRKYGGRMLAVAHRFFRCEADSADAVQDAFLAAFRSLDKFQGNSSLGTWLHRIVVNSCLTKLRTQSRRRAGPIDDLLPTFDETGHHTRPVRLWEEDALLKLSREETRTQVRACIERLPEPYRAVLLLRDIEELDTEQTAHHLGITPGTVKTRLHRARQALRTLLEPVFLKTPPS